jgi:pimeloyl-ACP methyl ester carboxylesterase
MRELARYWATDYDWRKCEAKLNALPQFVTTIDGLDIHFIHVRSPHEGALPLVMTHGWPGSVVEFVKVIGPLTDPVAHGGVAADAFHLVCPSLPGYGFSGKPSKAGWSTLRTAEAWDRLMTRLGYARYGAQGGDWGAQVTTGLGMRHAEHLAGIHLNMPAVIPDPATMDDLTEQEQAVLVALKHYGDWDSGYSKQQSTRPQTVGYGLVDSPAGLCAWIVEKFWSWTDCDGDPANVLSRDEVLDNVMLYWLPATGASSARMYTGKALPSRC